MESCDPFLPPTITLESVADDRIINCFLGTLARRSKKKVHAFPTFFFPAIDAGGFGRIGRWTRKVKIWEEDLLLFPLHSPRHWALIAADIRKSEIRAYDSLGGEHPGRLRQVLSYLDWEFSKSGQNFAKDVWKLKGNPGGLPLQTNNIDCGFFLCFYAERLACGEEPVTSVVPESKELRKFVAAALRGREATPAEPGTEDLFSGSIPHWSEQDLEEALSRQLEESATLAEEPLGQPMETTPPRNGSDMELRALSVPAELSPEWEVLAIERKFEPEPSPSTTPMEEHDVLSLDVEMDLLEDMLEEGMVQTGQKPRCLPSGDPAGAGRDRPFPSTLTLDTQPTVEYPDRNRNSDATDQEEHPCPSSSVSDIGSSVVPSIIGSRSREHPVRTKRSKPFVKRRRVKITMPDGTVRRINVRRIGLPLHDPFGLKGTH